MKIFNPQPIIIPVPVTQNPQQEEYRILLDKFEELKKEIAELKESKVKHKRRSKEEIENTAQEYSAFKSDGKPKARPADPIKSYDEFYAIQNYFWERDKIRDWTLWTVGVSLGLRISDLTKLKIRYVLNDDLTFKDKLRINEKKTGKSNECLITESIVDALTKYFDSIDWKFNMNDYIFKSQKKGSLLSQSGWRIISDAAKALNMKTVIGSHTMRKSFGCIAFCLGETTIDPYKMEILRIFFNHDNSRTTAGYVKSILDDIKDEYRIAVSDFVLGKSGVNELNLVKKVLEDK